MFAPEELGANNYINHFITKNEYNNIFARS